MARPFESFRRNVNYARTLDKTEKATKGPPKVLKEEGKLRIIVRGHPPPTKNGHPVKIG